MMGLQTAGIVGAIALAVGAAGGFAAGVKVIDGDRDKWRMAAHDYKRASGLWKARWTAEAGQRDADFAKAVAAVSEAESACSARVRAARKSEAAIHKLMARPVRVDAQGCPAPVIWRSDVLQASIRPEAR